MAVAGNLGEKLINCIGVLDARSDTKCDINIEAALGIAEFDDGDLMAADY